MQHYIRFPDKYGIQVYPTAADFPTLALDGAQAVAADTSIIYVYDSGTMSWIPVAAPGDVNAITALTGDVTANGPGAVPATVNFVGGASAANVASATSLALAATASNTASTIVRRDSSGNFAASTLSLVGANLSGLTASRVVVTNGSKDLTSSSVTITELNLLSGRTSLISSLNGLTASSQTFAVGTTGSDFNISSVTSTHTFNLPDAGAAARGVVSTGTQTIAGAKSFTSPTSFAIGSVSLSGIYFNTDTDSGFYQPAEDQLALSNNGVQTWFTNARNYMSIGSLNTKLAKLSIKSDANFTATGTTTVSSSTSVTLTSGNALNEMAVGGRVNASSNAGVIRTIKTIPSATSLTLDGNIGNGTSQTLNYRMPIQSWFDSSSNMVAFFNDQGRLGLYNAATFGGTDATLYVGTGNSAAAFLKIGSGGTSYNWAMLNDTTIIHTGSSSSTMHTITQGSSGNIQDWFNVSIKVGELTSAGRLNLYYGANNTNNLGPAVVVAHVNATETRSTNSGEETLITWDMPGNSIESDPNFGQRIVIKTMGTANTSGGSYIGFALDGSIMGPQFSVDGVDFWEMTVTISKLTDGKSLVHIFFAPNGGPVSVWSDADGIDLTSGHATSLRVNDQNTGNINQYAMYWDWYGTDPSGR